MTILSADQALPKEGGPSFSLANRIERLCWMVTWKVLCSWTPGNFSDWRMFMLRLFGAVVEPGAAIAASARVWLPRNLVMRRYSTMGPRVDCYNMAPIEIGEHAIVSQGAVLCCGTHDPTDRHFQLQAFPIAIGREAWVAAEAFVGPGVVVGEGAVLGARACAFRALKAWTIYGGNPAIELKPRAYR